MINLDDSCSCSIILGKNNRNPLPVLHYTENIINYVQHYAKVVFQELVADFIK